jgi:hypothetical protein
MKNPLLKSALIFSLVLSIVIGNSCKKDEETNEAINNLLGTWTINNSDVNLSVDGVDLVTYMVDNFGYSQQEAETLVSYFKLAIGADSQGTINFKDDNTYQLINSDGEENGSWSVNDEGSILTLEFAGEVDNLNIVSLTSSNLKLTVPTESEEVDLDDDGDVETTVDVDIELNLSK